MKRFLPRLHMPLTRLWTTLLFILFSLTVMAQRPFITTWQVEEGDLSVTIPTIGSGYDYHIYWENIANSGQNGTLTGQTGNATLAFPSAGTYRVEISGDFPQIYFNNQGDKDKILTVDQWGDIAWKSMFAAFHGAKNLQVTTTEAPNLSEVESLSAMFRETESFNQDLSSWDVSNVSSMFEMFTGAKAFNGSLNGWQPGIASPNGCDAGRMFRDTEAFNQDLSSWDVSNVSSMYEMFNGARAFNGLLNGWQPGTALPGGCDAGGMFRDAEAFDQDLSNWNVSNVSSMFEMFTGARAFNGLLNGWQPGSALPDGCDAGGMFRDTEAFDQDLSSWDVSNVRSMYEMFSGAKAFNGLLNGWQPGIALPNGCDAGSMFRDTEAFDQDLSSWDVSNVGSMYQMFTGAKAFNSLLNGWQPGIALPDGCTASSMFRDTEAFDQDLSSWDVSNVSNMYEMLNNSGLSRENYDATLIGWAAQENVPSDITLSAGGLTYCEGADARQSLIDDHGWAIDGDTEAEDCDGGTEGAFITTWQTTTANESILIPVNPNVTGYNYTVDWGDGNTSAGQTGNAMHTYATAGTYTVAITGDFPAIRFGNPASNAANDAKLLTIDQWGTQVWLGMEQAFRDCVNLTKESDTDAPVFAPNSSLEQMFLGCSSFDSDVSDWDVSQVSDMAYMFSATPFNHAIGNWDVSNVTIMGAMFYEASSFNQSLGDWDVSKVTQMNLMFGRATAFNQPLADWEVSNVTLMHEMFAGATAFNQPLGDWDVANVIRMTAMFDGARVFNQPLGNWDVSKVTTMQNMFQGASAFDQNLGSWDLSSITLVTGPIMGIKIDGLIDMLNNSGLSRENYDATLNGWAEQENLPSGIPLGAQGLTYCAGGDARQSLIDDHGWEITGDAEATDCDGSGGITPGDPANFVTTWKTDNDGPSDDNQIRVPATGDFNYLWMNVANPAEIGSGSGSGETTILFPGPGTYQLSITPTGSTPFHRIEFIQYASNDKNKLLEVNNWGTIPWSGFLFNGCSNLKITATDIPDLSGVTDLSFAFSNSGIAEIPNVNDWDVSNVTNMSSLFQNVTAFNQSLSNWDVSKVTDMQFMFDKATSFNQPLGSWDVSNLEDISYMFRDASSFNQSLGAWNLASIQSAIAFIIQTSMSCENYSYTLHGWATNPNTNGGIVFGAYGVTYSPDVAPFRDYLIETLNWNFQSGDEVGTCAITLPGPPITPDDNNILYVDINVNTTATDYTGAGDSWANAIPELADALKWGRLEHDGGNPGWTETDPLRIFVAKGEYKPLYNAADGAYTTDGGAENSFVLVPDVQLYGGFDPLAGIETLDDARILPNHEGNATAGSILSGDLNGNDAIVAPTFDRANHPSRQDNAHRVVSAFEISDNARLDGFTITGANYSNTSTSGHGGGLFLSHSSPTLSNLFITNNSITYSGGGIYLSKSTSAIRNVIISNNTAYNGAGMYTSEVVGLTLTNVTITNNVASNSGGGIHHFNLYPDNLILTNTTIAGNTPDAVYAWEPVSGNNVIVWGGMVNRDDQDPGYGFKNSLIEGNSSTAEGNIDATGITVGVIFTDPANGDYTLKENSPAIDAGDNGHFAGLDGDTQDVAGNQRLVGSTIDMGAYESSVSTPDATKFITTWQTTTANESIIVPVNPDVSGYNYTVDWGDGNTSAGQTGNATHTYATPGIHTVAISGDFPAIQFGSTASNAANDAKLVTIEQWGTQVWLGMAKAFSGCMNLTNESDIDAPVFAPNSSLEQMFWGCSSFDSDLSDWDVSQVSDMTYMFSATAFNHAIGNWDVSNVISMNSMFDGASSFNQPLGDWDVSKVTGMVAMFNGATAFNQPIGDWEVANVKGMQEMFYHATAFNQPLGDWDVSNVVDMASMFHDASSFNQPVGDWDVSKVVGMQNMFRGASTFDQNLGNWDLSNITYGVVHVPLEMKIGGLADMLNNSGLSRENYDATLTGWAAAGGFKAGMPLGAAGLTYCASKEARQQLLDDYGWEISGDIIAADCPDMQVFVVTPDGETFTVQAEGSDSFQQLKQKIKDQEDIPVEEQRLAFNGKEVADGRTLEDYGIVDGNTLHLWLPIVPDGATILYVNKHVDFAATGYTGAGDSWENALTELSTALDYAHANETNWTATTPLQIWVAKGLYKPTESTTYRQRYFNLLSNVAIYGGFAADETTLDQRDPGVNLTVLSGDIGGDDESDANGVLDDAGKIRGNNSFHVVDGSGTDRTAILNGFTITAGQANVGPTTTDKGGGVFMENGSPTLERLIISGNTADYGGGINIFANSSPILRHLIIRDNTASFSGGGISNHGASLMNNLLISGNSAQLGGGMFFGSAPTLTNLTVSGNTAAEGGGVVIFPAIAVELNNSILWGNSATGAGNEAAQFGGGLTSTLMLNYSLYRNRSGETDIDGAYLSFEPDAFSLNTSPDFISTDPTEIGFLQLGEGSPAINAGNNQLYTDAGGDLANDKDVAGNPRLTGGTIDMGTYESGVLPNRPPEATNVAVIGELTVGQALEGDYLFSDEDDDDESGSTYAWYRADDEGGTGKAAIEDSEGITYVLTGADIGKYISFEVTPHDGADAGVAVESTARGPVERQALTVTGSFTAHDKRYDGDESAEIDSDDLALDGLINGWADVSLENLVVSFDDAAIADGKTVRITNVELAGADAAVYTLDLTGLPVATANITLAPLTITDPVLTLTKAYDGTTEAEVEAGILSGVVAGEEVTVMAVATYADVDAASGKTITVSYAIAGADADNYSAPVDFISTDGVISPIPLTIVGLAVLDKEYDGTTTVTVAGTPTYDGLVAGESFDVSGEVDWAFADPNVGGDKPLISSGNYDVPSGNYTLTQPTLASTITAVEITVTVDDQIKVFGADDPALTYTFTPALIDDGAFTGGLDREEGESVGTYAITQGNLTLDDNYVITFEPATLTITPADIGTIADIEFNDLSFTYDGTEHTLTLTGELPEGASVSYEIDGESGNGAKDAGTYEMTAIIDGGENYEDTALTATLTITPLEITVTAANKSKVFGADDPALTYTFTPALIDDDAFTGGPDREEGESVGTYAITQGNLTLDDNYEITFAPATLTIIPADISTIADIEFNDLSFTYDGSRHTLTLTGELPEGASVSYEIDGEPGNGAVDAGTYEVTALIDGGDNYEDEELTATLTMTPLEIVVTAAEQTKIFGTDDPALTYTVAPELIGDDALSGRLERESGENVGSYAITQGSLSAGDNYIIAFEAGSLKITKAAADGTELNDLTVTYDGAEHTLILTGDLPGEASVSYEIDGEPGNGAIDAGTYEVTALIDGGDNYEDKKLTATLTISRATIDGIKFEDVTYIYQGTEREILIKGGLPAGTEVTYSNNSRTDAGTQGVTATISGDNYETLVLTADLTITPAERELDFPPLAEKTYGDADFEAGATASSGETVLYTSSDASVAEVDADGLITINGVGTATITARVPENGNYSNRPEVSRTLVVGKSPQTIEFEEVGEVHRDAGTLQLEVSASSGLAVGLSVDDPEVATVEGTTLLVHRLGTVRITATQAGDGNHEAAEPVTVTVRVVDPEAELPMRVTKVVSPNGDGINEYLIIEGIKDYPENKVTVFNRNGTVLYEAKGYNNGSIAFRGVSTGQQPMPAGTYFYVAEIRVDGMWKYEKGWFVLRY